MSADSSLVFPAAIDLVGLGRDLRTAESMVGNFADSAASRLRDLPVARLRVEADPMPSLAAPDAGGAGELADALVPAAGMLGSQLGGIRAALGTSIADALAGAVAPLNAFAADFRGKFDEVGATVEKLAIRIDDAMRFPGFIKRFEWFEKAFRRTFGLPLKGLAKDVDKGLGAAQARVEADAARLVEPFKQSASRVRAAVLQAIPDAVEYGVEAASHVDGKRAFAGFVKGLEEVTSPAIEKMRQKAEDLANATGKGSRKARWRARDLAASQQAARSAVPPRLTVTPASVRPPRDEFAAFKVAARGMGEVALDAAKVTVGALDTVAQGFARIPAGALAAYKGVAKLRSLFSTFGSVAKATFGPLGKIPIPLPAAIGGMKTLGQATHAASSAAKGLGFALTGALGPLSLVFEATSALRSFFVGGAKGASDLAETTNKVDVILGEGSPAARKFASDLSTQFGLVKGVVLDTEASFAGLGRSLGGLKGEKLAGFSNQFTLMAANLTSFSNLDLTQSSAAIQTALAGNQSDVLKELGVVYSDAAVKAYAYAKGVAKVGTELNERQKFTVRAALITQGLAKVDGDLAITQGGAANQARKLMGTIQNLATSIGAALLPAITVGLNLLNEFASFGSTAFESSKAVVGGWADTVIDLFDQVAAVVHHWPAAFEVARLAIFEKLANIGEYIAVLGPNAAIVAKYIGDNWLLLIGDALDATIAGLKNLWANFQAIGKAIGEWFADPTQGFHVDWTPLLDGFRATAEKFPDLIRPTLTDMSREIAAAARPITDEITVKRAKRAADKALPAAAPRAFADMAQFDEAEKPKKGKQEKTLSEALELGSKEAYSAVVSATAGRAKGLDAVAASGRETASNTARMANALDAQARDKKQPPKRLMF